MTNENMAPDVMTQYTKTLTKLTEANRDKELTSEELTEVVDKLRSLRGMEVKIDENSFSEVFSEWQTALLNSWDAYNRIPEEYQHIVIKPETFLRDFGWDD